MHIDKNALLCYTGSNTFWGFIGDILKYKDAEVAQFEGHYVAWRKTRIAKLISILGEAWFQGKTILEAGCGLGHVGEKLMELGARVTFADGRQIYLNEINKRMRFAETIYLDQDGAWDLRRKFDLIVHWGLLYHLKNWREDLESALKHSNLISLETEVMDFDGESELKIIETHCHSGIHQIGTRPSCLMLENYIKKLGALFERYDDKDLNAEYFIYDWKPGICKDNYFDGLRRFYLIRRNNPENSFV